MASSGRAAQMGRSVRPQPVAIWLVQLMLGPECVLRAAALAAPPALCMACPAPCWPADRQWPGPGPRGQEHRHRGHDAHHVEETAVRKTPRDLVSRCWATTCHAVPADGHQHVAGRVLVGLLQLLGGRKGRVGGQMEPLTSHTRGLVWWARQLLSTQVLDGKPVEEVLDTQSGRVKVRRSPGLRITCECPHPWASSWSRNPLSLSLLLSLCTYAVSPA